jgi:hypothetical protein
MWRGMLLWEKEIPSLLISAITIAHLMTHQMNGFGYGHDHKDWFNVIETACYRTEAEGWGKFIVVMDGRTICHWLGIGVFGQKV